MNKKIITISGTIGSGKTTICKKLQSSLSYDYLDIGLITRNLAKDYNMTIDEFVIYMKTHPEIDEQIDNYIIDTSKQGKSIIFSSRIGWYLIPDSFKIFLYCENEVAAKRVLNDSSRAFSESYSSLNAAIEKTNHRNEETQARLKSKYNVDIFSSNNYDLYIDTSYMSIDKVVDLIIKKLGESV